MKIAVVTFADDRVERYEHGIVRLKHSVKAMMSDADFVSFRTFEEIGSPTHKEMPYAFKAFAIEKARQMGYDLVLWCDSVVHATKSLAPVFDYIRDNGYMFFDNIGYTIGSYTNDACLSLMNMSREESEKHQMIMACCMGFDFRRQLVNTVFADYLHHATSGAYSGSWDNHRHDQSVMSILIAQNDLKILTGHKTYFAYKDNAGHHPMADSVCLISQ